ncbi:MAG TPA: phage shock protein PspA [Nevskiaceae bacterium]|nr:phage shock protein PspA [Nevskiaceae bacterium]
MSIFSRLSDVINSNIHAMLDKAEDPEKMVRLIIQEMEDTLVEVRSTSVRTIARRKEVERNIAHLQAEAADWQRKAELAVSKDRDDLARGALAAKQSAQDHAAALQKELAHVDQEIDKLDDDTAKLKAKLADARQRQKTIVLRQASVASRLRVKGQLNDRKMADTMLKMEQYEGKIDRLEAEVEAYDLGGRSLSDQIAALETNDKLEDELSQLRARLGKPAPAAPVASAQGSTPSKE